MRLRSVLIALTATATLAACSSSPERAPSTTAPTPTPSTSTPTPTPTPKPTPVIAIKGADTGLLAAVTKVYAGKTGLTGRLATGTWGKEQVAVVESGKDITLLVAPQKKTSWKVVGGWWPSLKKGPSLGKAPRFIAALGVDSRGSSYKGSRSDTIQIVGLDLKGGGGVIGVARDVWTTMPNGSKAKVNAAFQIGGGKGTVATLKRMSGLPIEGYVATGFTDFRHAVNAWGGIPITIPKAIHGVGIKFDLKAGRQTLNGSQALAYARERKALPDGDFGRSRHQGDLLVAIAIKARLQGVRSIAKDLTIVSKYSESNLSAAQVLTYAAALYKVNPAAVGHAVAKGGFGWSSDKQSIVLLDQGSRDAFKRFRDGRL